MPDQTVRAWLRRLHSPNASDLKSFRPADPEDFGVLVQAMIGPQGTEGEESFDFMLCTPRWIAREWESDGVRWARATLVVPGYDFEALESAVLKLCRRTEGRDWSEVAERLNRYMQREFEDYEP